MRAVSLGRALGDKDLLKVFRVAQQVGVDRIVAESLIGMPSIDRPI